MGITSGTWVKGDPRAKANGPKAFHQKLVNRGRRNGKKRWASMTQEEKDLILLKSRYAIEAKRKHRERLNKELAKHTHFIVDAKATETDMDDIENFFYGDVI